MRVSAIMPTYDQAEFIEEAIESVIDQVDELIVVDDGSTDDTRAVLAASRSYWALLYGKNRGTAAAINSGFKDSTGDLVTWVSSDNIHEPHWRDALESAMGPDVGAVYSAFRYGIRGTVHFTPYDPGRLIRHQACYFGPSFLILRDVWEAAGPHRGKISHDYDHWLRVEETCWEKGLGIVGLAEPLCDYRVHDKRVTVTRRDQYDADHWQAEARIRRATPC